MKKWKTIESNYLYKTPFGNLRKDKVELPNGVIINDYYLNEYSDWVNAIVLTKDKQLVLVKQYRHAAGDYFLEIPAGKIEQNETLEEGILREVREETGYTSKRKPVLLGEFMVNPATQTNKVITYLIFDAVKTDDQNLDLTEDLSIILVNLNEMESLIKSGHIKQLFTVSAYYIAKNQINEHFMKQ